MPRMKKGPNGQSVRDYSYDKEYQKKPEQVKNRVARNAARRTTNANGTTRVGDGKDVDHIKPLSRGGGNGASNLRAVPKGDNRSFARNADSSMKSQFSRRERKGKN